VWRFLGRFKYVVFGVLFFLANIVLLLQFVPVGGAILADRYTYIPYAGLFLIFGWLAGVVWYRYNVMKPVVATVLGGFLIFCAMQSSKRCADWYDTVSLWKDEVAKHPDVPSAFNNLGFEYFNRGNESADPKQKNLYFDSAVINLKEAIRLQPVFVNPYVSLGEVARSRNNFPEAKFYYYKALSLSKSDETHNAYLGLAIIYCITGQQAAMGGVDPKPYYDSAHYCFRTAIQVRPVFPEAHSNYGNFFDMMQNFDSSYREYSLAIEQNPDMYAPYLNRARLMQRHQKCDAAYPDFQKAIDVAPDNGEIYYARSYCLSLKGDRRAALADVEKARALGFQGIDPNYYQSLKGQGGN
jgi:tetratricopeptide (TPR) repeat protein